MYIVAAASQSPCQSSTMLATEASRIPIIFHFEFISPLAETCLSNLMFISSFLANRLPDTTWHGRRHYVDWEDCHDTRFVGSKKKLLRHFQLKEVRNRFNSFLAMNH